MSEFSNHENQTSSVESKQSAEFQNAAPVCSEGTCYRNIEAAEKSIGESMQNLAKTLDAVCADRKEGDQTVYHFLSEEGAKPLFDVTMSTRNGKTHFLINEKSTKGQTEFSSVKDAMREIAASKTATNIALRNLAEQTDLNIESVGNGLYLFRQYDGKHKFSIFQDQNGTFNYISVSSDGKEDKVNTKGYESVSQLVREHGSDMRIPYKIVSR